MWKFGIDGTARTCCVHSTVGCDAESVLLDVRRTEPASANARQMRGTGQLYFFFCVSGQFSRMLIGVEACSGTRFTRKRLPSGIGSYMSLNAVFGMENNA